MEEERLPNGLVCHDASLTEDEAIKLYNRDQLLWIRLSPKDAITFSHQTISQQYEQDPAFFSNHFSVENPCQHDPKHLTPSAVFGKKFEDISTDSGAYYVSSILQRNAIALSRFFQSVPFAKAPFLKEAYHDDGAWLFFGYNPILKEQHEDNISNASSSTSSSTRGTKRKKKNNTTKISTPPISGRPEHTDKVQHSGTWHVQLSGTKTWYVRPLKSASEWMSNPPNLKAKPGACQKNSSTRLRICVQPGDLLVINTRAWWHQTEIDPQKSSELVAKRQKKRRKKGKKNEKETASSALSISYARDFYLDGKPKKEKKESNCSSENPEEDPSKDSDEISDNDSNEDPGKTNDQTLDPRLIAKTMVYNGELAVVEEDLPENLPRSRAPNCELCVCEVEGEEMMCMLATRDIYIGEPFSIKVEDDEDAEDMEEWELNTTTGEMTRILPGE